MDAPSAHQSFEPVKQCCTDTLSGKFGSRVQPFEEVAANGAPSSHPAIPLGDPYLQFTKLSLHSGGRELPRPRLGLCDGHCRRRQLKDRSSPHFEEKCRVIERGQAMNSAIHVEM